MNKYHRVTHTSEHTRRVWDVTSMRRSTIVEIYEQILSTKTPPDTATTQLAPIHLRVARILLWVFILTLESSPTATQTAVSERFDPLFCSVPKHFNSECTLLIVSLFHDYWMARLSVAQGPCPAVLPTVHGRHYAFQTFPFFCVTLYNVRLPYASLRSFSTSVGNPAACVWNVRGQESTKNLSVHRRIVNTTSII